METERRLEKKRMKISRHMKIDCLDSGRCFSGETSDISDGGIRANLTTAPKTGSNIMVSLFWDDLVDPVESYGRVAWSAPLPPGEGIEVGLMLGAEAEIYGKSEKKKQKPQPHPKRSPEVADTGIETKKTVSALPIMQRFMDLPPLPLETGEALQVRLRGKNSDATIEEVGRVNEDGEIQITLRLKDETLYGYGYERLSEEEIDTSNWNSNPFKDAFATMSRYAGPVLKTCFKFSLRSGARGLELLRLGWSKIPAQYRAKTLDAVDLVTGHKLTKAIFGGLGRAGVKVLHSMRAK